MPEAETTELIKRAQDGDVRAFEMLVEDHYEVMFKMAFKWCGKKGDAEDITQEACIKLARGLHTFRHDCAFTSWLYRLVINAAKDWYKSQNRHPQGDEGMEFLYTEEDTEGQMYAKQVWAGVHSLPDGEKEALLLVMAQGLSHKEAAQILNIKESTVSGRIHEARKNCLPFSGRSRAMDDQKLKDILSKDYSPEVDVNARKRVVNLAVAAFKTNEAEKIQKSSQGVSILSRLMGMSNTSKGRETMEQRTKKKFIYGGMATAMAVVFVAALSVSQLDDAARRFASTATSGATEGAAPAYVAAVETKNAGAALSSPVPSPQEKLVLPETTASESGRSWNGGKFPEKAAKKADIEEDRAEVGTLQSTLKDVKVQDFATDGASAPIAQAQIADTKNEPAFRQLEKSKELSGYVGNNMVVASPPAYMPQPVDTVSPSYHDEGRDKFTEFKPNAFKQVAIEPVSTFSSDVDTASYSFVRRQLNNGQWPQPDAVRVEEMVNYFEYNYPLPESQAEPFKPTVTVIDSPWAKGKKLMHIGIKGYDIKGNQPHANLVFLLDVSGSMEEPNKLPLVKASLKMLLDTLKPDDTVAITVYAGAAGTVLEPTKISERNKIIAAIDNLNAGGSTAGEAGINAAYTLAEQNFDKEGVNRIILATDGDFNVGTSSTDELKALVEKKRESGIFLSVLGFGEGNYNDAIMQTLAQNGNGVAAYIDTLNEARKVLVDEARSSLFPIAKDVKFQVEFNPAAVAEYRLVGYETRALNREDFNNDKIDAGDMGAGHTVTAIYEFVPVGSEALSVDALRYASKDAAKPAEPATSNGEYAFVKVRYKLPNENTSKLITTPVTTENLFGTCPALMKCKVAPVPQDTQFAVAVAAFAQILKNDPNIQTMTLDDVINLAQSAKGEDAFGYRAEFINLVRLAKSTHH